MSDGKVRARKLVQAVRVRRSREGHAGLVGSKSRSDKKMGKEKSQLEFSVPSCRRALASNTKIAAIVHRMNILCDDMVTSAKCNEGNARKKFRPWCTARRVAFRR